MISLVKPGGWAVNEKLTSAQVTAIDQNTSFALDKRVGQTDSLLSEIEVNGSGKINFNSGSGSGIIQPGSTLINNGSIIGASSSFNILQSGSTTLFSAGSIVNHAGQELYDSSILISTSVGATFNLNGAVISANDFSLTGTSKVKFNPSRSITRSFANFKPSFFNAGGTLVTKWIHLNGTHISASTTGSTSPSVNDVLYAPIRLPNNCTITSLSVYILPAVAHIVLPSTRPNIILVRNSVNLGTVQNIGSANDASASVATYETLHPITISSFTNPVIDNSSYGYNLIFRSEFGSDSAFGLTVYGYTATFTMSEMDEV
jgi:hypothetical protein